MPVFEFITQTLVKNSTALPDAASNWATALAVSPGLPSCAPSSMATWSEPMIRWAGKWFRKAWAFSSASRLDSWVGVSPAIAVSSMSGEADSNGMPSLASNSRL